MIKKDVSEKAAEVARAAYSKIVRQDVTLEYFTCSDMSFHDFLKIFNASVESIVTVVFFLIYHLDSNAKQKVAGCAVATYTGQSYKGVDEHAMSALSESANMLLGAYLGEVSNETNHNLRASIQPVFMSTPAEAAKILEHQLYRGDEEEEMSVSEFTLQSDSTLKLSVFFTKEVGGE